MKIGLYFLGVFMICSSCSDANDDVNLSLNGEWMLTNVLCYCAFDENVDFSTSMLLFDTNATTVTVVHEGNDAYFHVSGHYSYTIKKDTITLTDDSRGYTYKIEGDLLTLNYVDNPMIADDEVSFKYRRID